MTTKINVKGPIISNDDKFFYDLFGMDSTAPKDVIDELPDDNSDVEVDINSGGGLVESGSEIYTALMAYQGKVTVNIVGMAASAASIIAMAGTPTRISPVGQIMIHNASAAMYGDYHDQDKLSEILKQLNTAMASAYELKTGLSKDDILSKMDAETYLNADEAKELGFVDEVMFDDENVQLVADGGSGLLPKSAINKVKELLNEKKSDLSDDDITRISDSVVKKINVKPQKQTKNSFNPFAF